MSKSDRHERVVVVLDGQVDGNERIGTEITAADFVVAADGGARRLGPYGRIPDLVVGDLDSLAPAEVTLLERAGTKIERHPTEKDAIDGELALLAALERNPLQVTVLGALGGSRADMVLANLLLLCHPQLATTAAWALAADWAIWPVPTAGIEIGCQPGQTLSLLPLDARVAGVELSGAQWELSDETLRRGTGRALSNVTTGQRVSISARQGRLLAFLKL